MNKYEEIIKKYENKLNNNNEELNIFINKIEDLLKTIKNMIKTSQLNQSIQIDFQKELINTYKYMKNEKNLNFQIIENVRNIMKIPIKIELNADINEIIHKNNILYENFINEIKYKLGIIKNIDIFKDFKFENMNNYKTLNNNKGLIYCLQILDDKRLAASDSKSNLIIYNKETFNPDITIQNNCSSLLHFKQLKNKNIAVSFISDFTIKIIKIKNEKDYEIIQTINKAHNNRICKILELKNENIITFSEDKSFKIWKLNNNKYEVINEIKENNIISNGIEIKENEILYDLNTKPQSIKFYDLNKYETIKILNNLNLNMNYAGTRMIQLNDEEVAIAGVKKVYFIDINKYQILNEISSDSCYYSILKLSNCLFLAGDGNGTIIQYKVENKKLIKNSWKNVHQGIVWSMNKINNMIISGGGNGEIILWKK